ncbi:hypothetical protein LTR53_014860 [Teratosphaeriaceae sp. CCFEE 6253]|nr:hypothetical protein LTR53_014860 [Teratosphaeriaceae sp. CCFEE 6253]
MGTQPAAFITLATIGCIIELVTFVAAAMVTIPLQTSRTKRAHVLAGFSPSFIVIACFIASAAVLPANALAADFTTSRIRFEIACELTLLFLIIYCTAAPLFQVGRRFQTGYNAPIIDGNHTMSGSNSGTRKYPTNIASVTNGSRHHGGSQLRSGQHHGGAGDTYDLGSVTAGKLANPRYVSSVSAQDRLDREAAAEEYRSRVRRERHVSGDGADGESMASDSSQKIIIRRTVEQHSTML